MVNFLKSLFKPRFRTRSEAQVAWAKKTRAGDQTSRSSKSSGSRSKAVEGLLGGVINACSAAIVSGTRLVSSCSHSDAGSRNAHLVGRIVALLEAQRDEMNDMGLYVAGRRFPALVTLQQIYDKLETSLQDVATMPPTVARDTLIALVQVVQEGPDYLIDIILISTIIFQAEIIDMSFAFEIRQILERAIDNQSDLETFRKATESIIPTSSAMPEDLLDDDGAQEAYDAIGVLVKQLQIRVATSIRPTPMTSVISIGSETTPTPLSLPSTPLLSTNTSPISTPVTSPTPSVTSTSTSSTSTDPNFFSMNASDLETKYGTGVKTSTPLRGLSSYNSTPAPTTINPTPTSSASSDASDEEEVWEYREQLLTRSALDLVLRQEALAQADSSGQYAGEVSYDDLRKAWIPRWVQKLGVEDLAEDEIPDLTPAGFKPKTKDEWGNELGWYGPYKEMYYKEEPKFEMPVDD
ncbi:hypothetical protein IAR55_003663 [Kwoniella newhampshirensis]|uniref:Uncharacterized protein n=1 Tax=Kwoniella newhampshirensis TaxID=1651941 RepID=A0AAW0YZS0_9TREE